MHEITEESHQIIKQFLLYRQTKEKELDRAEDFKRQWKGLELQYALKAPVMEATYAMMEGSPFKLFDPLYHRTID